MGNPTLERVNEYQISKASNDDDSNYRKNKVYMDVYHSVCDYDMSLTSSQILLLEDMLSYAIRIPMAGYVLKEAIYIGNIVSFIATCGEVNKELVFSGYDTLKDTLTMSAELINAIFAGSFDDISIIPTFILFFIGFNLSFSLGFSVFEFRVTLDPIFANGDELIDLNASLLEECNFLVFVAGNIAQLLSPIFSCIHIATPL